MGKKKGQTIDLGELSGEEITSMISEKTEKVSSDKTKTQKFKDLFTSKNTKKKREKDEEMKMLRASITWMDFELEKANKKVEDLTIENVELRGINSLLLKNVLEYKGTLAEATETLNLVSENNVELVCLVDEYKAVISEKNQGEKPIPKMPELEQQYITMLDEMNRLLVEVQHWSMLAKSQAEHKSPVFLASRCAQCCGDINSNTPFQKTGENRPFQTDRVVISRKTWDEMWNDFESKEEENEYLKEQLVDLQQHQDTVYRQRKDIAGLKDIIKKMDADLANTGVVMEQMYGLMDSVQLENQMLQKKVGNARKAVSS